MAEWCSDELVMRASDPDALADRWLDGLACGAGADLATAAFSSVPERERELRSLWFQSACRRDVWCAAADALWQAAGADVMRAVCAIDPLRDDVEHAARRAQQAAIATWRRLCSETAARPAE